MPNTRPHISVIVPALNEEDALPTTLSQLMAEPHVHEILVVDGGSTDSTRSLVAAIDDPRVSLLRSAPGRGRQMNVGAHNATGNVLLFHHADTLLTPGALAELHNRCCDPAVLWGGFLHAFSAPNWKLRLVSALHNVRFRLSGAVYGDQSMFVRTEFFNSLGGFPEEPLEDLLFSDTALQLSPPIRLRHRVVTESRKFVQMGEFTALGHVVAIVVRYQLNRRFANEQFFRPYR